MPEGKTLHLPEGGSEDHVRYRHRGVEESVSASRGSFFIEFGQRLSGAYSREDCFDVENSVDGSRPAGR